MRYSDWINNRENNVSFGLESSSRTCIAQNEAWQWPIRSPWAATAATAATAVDPNEAVDPKEAVQKFLGAIGVAETPPIVFDAKNSPVSGDLSRLDKMVYKALYNWSKVFIEGGRVPASDSYYIMKWMNKLFVGEGDARESLTSHFGLRNLDDFYYFWINRVGKSHKDTRWGVDSSSQDRVYRGEIADAIKSKPEEINKAIQDILAIINTITIDTPTKNAINIRFANLYSLIKASLQSLTPAV